MAGIFLSLFMIFSIIGPLPVMAGSGGVETGADLESIDSKMQSLGIKRTTLHPTPGKVCRRFGALVRI